MTAGALAEPSRLGQVVPLPPIGRVPRVSTAAPRDHGQNQTDLRVLAGVPEKERSAASEARGDHAPLAGVPGALAPGEHGQGPRGGRKDHQSGGPGEGDGADRPGSPGVGERHGQEGEGERDGKEARDAGAPGDRRVGAEEARGEEEEGQPVLARAPGQGGQAPQHKAGADGTGGAEGQRRGGAAERGRRASQEHHDQRDRAGQHHGEQDNPQHGEGRIAESLCAVSEDCPKT